MKTLIIQNYWTPYRHELFTELAQLSDIEVLYLGKIGSDRLWDKEETSFPSIQLSGRKLGPFFFSDLSGIDFSRFDQAVLLEHMENIFTVLKLAAVFKGRFFLWTGMGLNTHPEKPGYDLVLNLFKRWYRKQLYGARLFLAYCELTKEMLLKAGIPDERIRLIHQASRIKVIPEIREHDPVEYRRNRRGPLRLLSLGYLRKEKNNDFLIKVCRRFSKDEIVLTIVGDGPEKERLKALDNDNRVAFKGYLEGDAKFREYLEADVFVLPTLRDPWALVVNEAMYYGLPVICSSRAGARDMVKDNGFVFDPQNEEDLYCCIDNFVKNRELVLTMGVRSKAIVSDYTIPFAARQLQSILEGEET
jgi:glycosyltransferase involved in cell wall biosynthesis